MSRFVDKISFFDRRASPMEDADGIPRSGLLVHHPRSPAASPPAPPRTQGISSSTLAQLFKRVSDTHSDSSSPPSSPSTSTFTLELATPMLQPFVGSANQIPFVLSFTDLTYKVKVKRPKKGSCLPSFKRNPTDGAITEFSSSKTLLDSISGEAREGEILAVLGASGSGKSTLIDALANRIVRERLHGSVTLNGEHLDSQILKVISAYVMQDDLLYPMLTVEETLMFSAEFRLPRTLSADKKKARVQALIDQLGLRSAANTIIGDEGHRGVSGGERRRVSIGTDIIHDPIILFLDEPTSGLDSTSAYMVVKVLQRIAHSGSIVIMSVHQPSYRILSLLDRLLLSFETAYFDWNNE
ncbi:ABC transporter G family member 5 [Rhynchospora pubera]|uniref:ABC transporter G family member 5 n=1 Tax=Rhynchospora pubera TaxID=906938 RepID=A0AAV8FLK6_9POAL|nr:ABC transporter G family member 5 [Rhynchospora pubera]